MNKHKSILYVTFLVLTLSLGNSSAATYYSISSGEEYAGDTHCINNLNGYTFDSIAEFTVDFKETDTQMTVESVSVTVDVTDSDITAFCLFDIGDATGSVEADINYYDNDGNLIDTWWGNEVIAQQQLDDEDFFQLYLNSRKI